jgi:Domain of unknown function (DUF5753)/Helix-turn-helix domain
MARAILQGGDEAGQDGRNRVDDIRTGGYSPTIRKRSLSRKLVELRKNCGLTTTQVQLQLNWSASKLNYIEKAKWIEPNSDAVADLCELYGVEGRERDALIQLAREGRQRGWWTKYNDVFSNELPGFEAGASRIRTFETTLIPGLLQVPSYIDMVTRGAGIEGRDHAVRHVDARVERQKILVRETDPCQLLAIMDENAITRIADPGIRKDQLSHLIEMGARENVDIQVIPVTAGIYPGAGEVFELLSFPDPAERDFVYLESSFDDRMLEETDEVERYQARFDRLSAAALSCAETTALLRGQLP